MEPCKERQSVGRIHSIETFGTVDGPGTRMVVFFQGCPMRCKFCHNPDTWNMTGGTLMTVEEILDQYDRNQMFYRHGGLTATGGEPLVQLEFLIRLFQAAKERGIHTCLDTSGIMYRTESKELVNRYEALFQVTDLIMLDIKCSDPRIHEELTRQPLVPVLEFAKAASVHKVSLRIRHVVVPGINDRKELFEEFGELIAGYSTVRELEVLPYHKMGIHKYESLDLPYPLMDTEALSKEEAEKARRIILSSFKRKRKSMQYKISTGYKEEQPK